MTKKRRIIDYYARKAVRGDDDIIVAAFDSETDGLGGQIKSVQWGLGTMGEIKCDVSPDMIHNFFVDFLQAPYPVVWFGHFAQYDWRYLLTYIIDKKLRVEISMRNETDVYQITVWNDAGQKCIMRDSYALWNSKLEKLASSFCPEIPKLELDFETTKFNPSDPYHIEYAKRDVQILLVGLPRLNSLVKLHFGVNPNATFASTALKGWQVSLADDVIYNSSKFDEQELFIRQGYYGGLVFLTSTKRHLKATTFDINSSYPDAMVRYGVPYGRVLESRDYLDGRMGIYRCRVRTPDNLVVPILPARDAKGNMRWYRGEFETVCTNSELIFAASNGYEILEIFEGLVWEETIFPFTPFINKCKTIRKEYHIDGAMSPEEWLAKSMQASLYGKYGTRRERFRLMAAHMMSEQEILESEPWGETGDWYVKRKEMDEEMRCMPAWAVFITAHARLKLLQAVYTVGVENVLYGDTDSITMIAGPHEELMDSGDDYGQWKREKEWTEFRAIAPKVYSGILTNGKRVGAAKGLPRKNLNDGHWKSLLEDGKASAQALSLASLRVSLKTRDIKPAHTLLRKSSTLTNSTNFEELQNGQVRAKMAA